MKFCWHNNQDKKKILCRWRTNIIFLARGIKLENQITETNTVVVPKLLIFVNPNSGKGSAVKTFNSRIRLFLGEADISYELIVTNSSGHCKQFIMDVPNLRNYAGIVAVSGDGLLFEVNCKF